MMILFSLVAVVVVVVEMKEHVKSCWLLKFSRSQPISLEAKKWDCCAAADHDDDDDGRCS